ncbi:MAG: tetratricopeptide repeat protein [Oscillatoria sp. SIO1A7]|nr:tetratricopeptide repeat protein [Oscillatoria sp. SIO1A7]
MKVRAESFFPKRYEEEARQAIAGLGRKKQNQIVLYGPTKIRAQLCRFLAASLQEEFLCAYVDGRKMKEHSLPSLEKAVRHLRGGFPTSQDSGDDFSLFDWTYLYYAGRDNCFQSLARPQHARKMERADMASTGVDLASAALGLFGDLGLPEPSSITLELASFLLSELIDFAKEGLPYVTFLAKLNWVFVKGSERVQQWCVGRREELQELQKCVSPYQVLELLPKFFTRDLREYLARHEKQAIVFVDDWQAFEETGKHFWLEEMIKEDNPNVLWLISADRPLESLEASHSLPVLPLTESETIEFLGAAGIADNTRKNYQSYQVCQAIADIAQGVPFYLNACAQRWQKIQNEKKRSPRVEDFAENPEEFMSKEDEAWNPEERRMLQILSVPRTWDETLFENLIEVYGLGSWRGRFGEVAASPYVESALMDLQVNNVPPTESDSAIAVRAERSRRRSLPGGHSRPSPLLTPTVRAERSRWRSLPGGHSRPSPLLTPTVRAERSRWRSLPGGLSPIAVRAERSRSLRADALNKSRCRFHPEVRQHLQETQPEAQRRSVASWLCQRYQEEYARESANAPTADRSLPALEAALYHGLNSDRPLAAIDWFLEQVPTMQQANQHEAIVEMLRFLLENWPKIIPSSPDSGEEAKPQQIALAPSRLTPKGAATQTKPNRANAGTSEILPPGEEAKPKQIALAWGLLGFSLIALAEDKEAIAALETAKAEYAAGQLGESLLCAKVEYDLARAYLKLERVFDASNAAQRCLKIRTAECGEDSPLVAEVLNRKADIATRQRQYREAIIASDRALKILEASSDSQPLQLAELKKTAAFLSYCDNRLDAAAKLCQEAMELAKSARGSDHPLAIYSQALLGYIRSNMGKHRYQQAFADYQEALAAAETVFGPSHPDTLNILEALIDLCIKVGQDDAAEEFAERLRANKQIGDFQETIGAAKRLNNLGMSLLYKGEYGKAEPLLKRASRIYLKLLGEEHPDTASSLNNLAALYVYQGRYEEAELLLQQALSISRKVLGEEHPDTATSLNNLAGLYEKQGRYEEAEPLYERALSIRRKVLGEEHPDTAQSLNNLAGLYKGQGRYAEAELLYERALSVHRKVLGEEHPDTASSLNNLAALYVYQGRYEEAELLLQQALSIYRKVLGKEHPDTAQSLNNLALLYDTQGRYAEAEPLYKQALSIRRKVLGEEHPDTATSLNNLAALYDTQGRYAEAEPLYKQALSIRRKVLGEEHPDTASSLNNLAALYEKQGRYAEAEPLYDRALSIYRKVLGEEHPDTASSLNNLASLYHIQGRYPEAEPLYKQALSILRKVLGKEHPDTASSLNNLAELYNKQGRYAEAELLYEQALSILRKVLGEEHPNTKKAASNLQRLRDNWK